MMAVSAVAVSAVAVATVALLHALLAVRPQAASPSFGTASAFQTLRLSGLAGDRKHNSG